MADIFDRNGKETFTGMPLITVEIWIRALIERCFGDGTLMRDTLDFASPRAGRLIVMGYDRQA